ncbi:type II secretion system secretin GspD [Roseibium sp. MMSF_3412]|uniref:type II secretion system secretin GspD n=1 Tax=Roseibium sp. MMSF_3412 TaxID=3046712 RepID=UPI00273F2282|nr:type II secretion system secretin GspD [Roseibium sp. MMSF_3412]
MPNLLASARTSGFLKASLACLFIAACANSHQAGEYDLGSNDRFGAGSPSGFNKSFLVNGTVPDAGSARTQTETLVQGQRLSQGSGKSYRYATDDRVDLNLRDASVEAASQAIIGEILGRTFVISPDVSGTVTLQTTNSIAVGALLEAFNTILAFNDAGLVERGEVVYIEPLGKLEGVSPKLQTRWGARGSEIGRSIKIVPLDFVAAAEIAELLKPLVGEDKILHVNKRQNLIFITGNPREIGAALDAINLFDVDVMRGQSFALIPVKNADAETIAKELQAVFSTQEGGALAGVVKFVPNNRLASILVISTRPHYLEDARLWVERFDRAAAGASPRLFVYSVQNREAEDLAEILQAVLTGGEEEEDGDGSATPTTATVTSPATATNRFESSFEAASTERARSQPAVSGSQTAFSTDGIRVIADTSNNAVLLYATQAEYETILPMIRQLDSLPNQVLLEATIAEVTLTDELKFGLRWFFESGNFSFKLSDVATGAVGATNPGFSLLFSAGETQIALNALSSITDVNIISSPNLMVLDNRQAVLQIGDQVPIATESAVDTTATGTVVNSIELKDTGIILTVTPRVNDSGRVILDITQEVSDVVATTTSGIDSPTIRQRKVTTTVVVNDGDSLALGGLIQKKDELVRSHVPVLGDVPIVGNLFKNKQDTEQRTELLILITPHVVRDFREANDVTQEFREQLGGLSVLGDTPERGLRHQLFRVLR